MRDMMQIRFLGRFVMLRRHLKVIWAKARYLPMSPIPSAKADGNKVAYE
jgi:hypothetical protein